MERYALRPGLSDRHPYGRVSGGEGSAHGIADTMRRTAVAAAPAAVHDARTQSLPRPIGPVMR